MGPNRGADDSSWKTLTAVFIAFLACADDAETMRRVALEQVQDGAKMEWRLGRVQETPSASFALAFRKAKAAALSAGQTTVMEVTFYDVYSLEPPNPDVEGKCGENANEEEDEEEEEEKADAEEGEVKEDTDNGYQPRKCHPSFSHLFHIGIGPEGGMIWQGRWLIEYYGLDVYARYNDTRIRSWDEMEQFAAGFEQSENHEASCITAVYAGASLVANDCSRGPGRLISASCTRSFSSWILTRSTVGRSARIPQALSSRRGSAFGSLIM